MRAYCYASGHIDFGPKVPDGALPIARGPAKTLRDFIEPLARHGYRTESVDGRPQKIPGTDMLLVPGVPEAPDQSVALDNFERWLDWIRSSAPKRVTVL